MDFKQADRDMLIAHDVKLTEVCRTLHKMDGKMDKLNEKMDDNVKTYITKKMFLSINGIIIFLLISLFAYTASLDKQINENKIYIEQLHSEDGRNKK
jgi:hypothetical protein